MTKCRPKVKTTTGNTNTVSTSRLLNHVQKNTSFPQNIPLQGTGSDLKRVKGKATGSNLKRVKGKATGSDVKGTPAAMQSKTIPLKGT